MTTVLKNGRTVTVPGSYVEKVIEPVPKLPDKQYNMIMQRGRVPKDLYAQGWHFCADWDELLIGPGMPEMETCLCQLPGGQLYKDLVAAGGNRQ